MQTSIFKMAQLVTPPVLAAIMIMPAQAAETTINDIEFVGLQRLTADSLYPLLTTNVGEVMSEQDLANSIEALYATGNFGNIQAQIENGVVTYYVVERPIIAEVEFEGNKLIPEEGLKEGLKYAGLSVGDVLKQSTVQNVANELQQQYIGQGYYNSDIEVDQQLLDGNRVKLKVRFIEGSAAKVVDINIIGNEYFSDEDIKDVFAVKETSWTNILSKSDRYAKEKLAASIENLKSKYMNEGFVNFTVNNAILNINDEKDKVFIEVSINEGEQYQFGNVNFLGKPNYSNDELAENVNFKPGEQFSQAKLEATTTAIKNYYGNDGYYYAQVRPVPRINDANKTVDIDYYIDPARPVYVRRINFDGNTKTEDEVLRREMRQLEGALASSEKIQSSRIRLMRTGFFKTVDVEVKPVANSPDQIDINFTVEEQPSGSSTIAAGYSQSGGVTFQLDFNQRNFLGTGNRVEAAFSRSETRDSYSLGITDPYFTVNGVSQGISGYYRKTKYDDRNVSNYVSDSYGATLNYSYPIDETKRLSAGFNYDNTDIRGGRFMGVSNVDELLQDDGKMIAYQSEATETEPADPLVSASFSNEYNTYNLLLGWQYSSLDRPVFPTKGMNHNVNATIAFGDEQFQKIVYKGNIYYPVYKDLIARGYAKLGYGNDLPFYENFYAGGYGSVRGYDVSSLGPRSIVFNHAINGGPQYYEEVGGNALATFGAELILPMPFKGDWVDQVRPVLFVEGGQVFDTTDKEDKMFKFDGKYAQFNEHLANDEVPLLYQDNKMRYSAGAGVTWYTPIGPISISYAKPFGDQDGDKTEEVQFQIGSTF